MIRHRPPTRPLSPPDAGTTAAHPPTAAHLPTAPGPALRPPGQLRALRADPLGFLSAMREQHGPIVRLRLGLVDAHLVSEPAAIEEVLVRSARHYTKGLPDRRDPTGAGNQPLARLLGRGLLTSVGDDHLAERRRIQPAFARSRVDGYVAAVAGIAARRAAGWLDGEVLDVDQEMAGLALDAVTATLFSAELDADRVRTLRRALAVSLDRARGAVLPWADLVEKLPLPASRRWRAAREDLHRIAAELVAARPGDAGQPENLIGLLLAGGVEAGTPEDARARDHVLTMLLAGHETTANALTWTLLLLGRHPEADRTLAAEVAEVLDGRPPTATDLPRLRYTGAVVAEGLRLYPPAWLIARRAVVDTRLGGHPIRAGSMVLLSPWVVHRDPSWWPEPDRFDPGRWLRPPGDRPRFAYFPFGGGARQCIGNNFAMMEATVALATIAGRHRLDPPSGPDPVPEPRITLRASGGLRMTAHVRQQP